ncbi:MAG: hypothetical protein B6245_16810, partial [Desulfobacteraceae bacterium 4572_88]
DVVWISLGTFRFMPSLKPIIQDRFPDSKIIYGEFIPGLDGKMRYFKPLRIRLYHGVRDGIFFHVLFCVHADPMLPKGVSRMIRSSVYLCTWRLAEDFHASAI